MFCQEKAREEVDRVAEKYGGALTGDALAELKYLEQVVMETNRMDPLPFMLRRCTKDWVIPGTDITMPKGMRIRIPVYPIHVSDFNETMQITYM